MKEPPRRRLAAFSIYAWVLVFLAIWTYASLTDGGVEAGSVPIVAVAVGLFSATFIALKRPSAWLFVPMVALLFLVVSAVQGPQEPLRQLQGDLLPLAPVLVAALLLRPAKVED